MTARRHTLDTLLRQTPAKTPHLLADVLVIGAQGGVQFKRRLSQLVRVLQVVVQLCTNTYTRFF